MLRVLSYCLPSLNNESNNIGVGSNVVCHTEHSEVSLFCALLRSFTFVIRQSSSKTSFDFLIRYGQNDKLTQKMKHGSTAILLP